jgi:glycogen operon protein
MMLAGDELGHTQNGNNNAYCQDNEMSWSNWDLSPDAIAFLGFVKKVAQFWREQPVLHRRKFFQGRSIRGEGVMDVSWFSPSGKDMDDGDWSGFVQCLGVRLAGDLIGETDDRGEPIVGDSLLVLLNAHFEPIPFVLPPTNPDHRWECVFDTADDAAPAGPYTGGAAYPLRDRSTAVFRTRPTAGEPSPTPLQVAAIRADLRRAAPPALGNTG